MTEHFYSDLLAHRTADVLAFYLFMDMLHLVHIQFACQYRHICKTGIELQRLGIGDVELGRKVYLSYLITVGHDSHIAGYNSRDACLLGCINDFFHRSYILIIYHGVYRQICLNAMLIAGGSYFAQVVDGEMVGRV